MPQPVRSDLAIGYIGCPAIKSLREGIAGDPTGIPVTPQGEPEEEPMDSDPDLKELVQFNIGCMHGPYYAKKAASHSQI